MAEDFNFANAMAVLNRLLQGQFIVAQMPKGMKLSELLARNDLAALKAAKGWGFRCQDGHMQQLTFTEFYMVMESVHKIRDRLVENAALLREKAVKHAEVNMHIKGFSADMDCAKLTRYFAAFSQVIFPPPVRLKRPE